VNKVVARKYVKCLYISVAHLSPSLNITPNTLFSEFWLVQNIAMDASGGTQDTEVDIVAYPTAKKLLTTCRKFFGEIENL
jgi:hypothetical protein